MALREMRASLNTRRGQFSPRLRMKLTICHRSDSGMRPAGGMAPRPVLSFAKMQESLCAWNSAVRQLAGQSHVPKAERRFVDKSKAHAHVDPLVALPQKNAFLKTLVPFLKRIG